MNRKLIARQLILEAKRLLAAGKDDSDYIYDPDHKHKPKGGHWEQTEKGWSRKKEEKKDKKKKRENVGQKEFSSLMKKLENYDYDKVDVSVFEKLNLDQLEQVLDQYDHIGYEQLDAFLKNPFFFETGVIEPEDAFGFESLPNDPKKAQNLFNKRINALIENPSTPSKILETLATGEIERCADSGGVNLFEGTGVNIPNEIAEKARRILQNNTRNTLSEPRRKTKTFSIETLKELRTKEQEDIAAEPETPPDILRELGKSRSKTVRKVVAGNPNTPVETLIKLSKDKQEFVRSSVARNPNTPVDILIELSKDEDSYVKECVVKNPNTPVETLIKLSKDDTSWVRAEVAASPNTPVDILAELGKDDNYLVKLNIAGNPNTPVDTLAELGKDEEVEVKVSVARNPNTPVDILVELSKDKKEFIKECAAGNPNTPVDTLVELSKDEDSWVRKKAQEELQKRKSIENAPIDLSKLSPELREQVKDMDPEELEKFIGWLKERKG